LQTSIVTGERGQGGREIVGARLSFRASHKFLMYGGWLDIALQQKRRRLAQLSLIASSLAIPCRSLSGAVFYVIAWSGRLRAPHGENRMRGFFMA
jgi:hypothetical protein